MAAENPLAQLKDLTESGAISVATLSTATAMSEYELAEVLSEKKNLVDPMAHMSLGMLAAQLVAGTKIDDHERLQGILSTLIQQYRLSRSNISKLLDLSADDLLILESEPAALSGETRFLMAIRLNHLLTVLSQVPKS